jgi:hypothetical protein
MMESKAMMKKTPLFVGVSAVALMFGASLASAQVLDVTQKPRPESDPIGVSVGSFILFPEVTVRETFDSNIFAVTTGETDDFITNIKPSLTLDSNWNNHALSITADANLGIYGDNSAEDYANYGIVGDGLIDVRRNFNVFFGSTFQHLHEDRGSPNAAVSTEPTEYDRHGAHAGFDYKPNRFGVIGQVGLFDLDYDNTFTSAGVVNNNADRDRQVTEGSLQLSYDFSPGYTGFVRGVFNEREYDTIPDDAGVNRNSDGYNVNGGVEFEITGTVIGEAFVGYFEQDYEAATLSNNSGVNFGGRALWSVSELTSVHGTLTRNVHETTTVGASSYLSTSLAIGVDHELMRNLLIGASAGLTNNDYDGISRDDDVVRLGAYGKYFITRNFFAGVDAQYIDRDSDVAGVSYDRYKIGASIGAQF